jgi:hypothetical protein
MLDANSMPPEVERWTCTGAWAHVENITRHVEIHTDTDLSGSYGQAYGGYKAFMNKMGKGLYVKDKWSGFPHATLFPADAMASILAGITGDPDYKYFSSTVGHMLALALTEGREYNPDDHKPITEISLPGVHMANGDEYDHQRPNAEFLIGLAMGRGIKVNVPAVSPILKGPMYEYDTQAYMASHLRDRMNIVKEQRVSFENAVSDALAKENELAFLIAKYSSQPGVAEAIGEYSKAPSHSPEQALQAQNVSKELAGQLGVNVNGAVEAG